MTDTEDEGGPGKFLGARRQFVSFGTISGTANESGL